MADNLFLNESMKFHERTYDPQPPEGFPANSNALGLEQLCREWQKRLRLQDWNIRVRLVEKCDIEGAFARTTHNPRLKEAAIRLARADSLDPDTLGCRDLEATLVHELLHLHSVPFDTFGDDTPQNTALETMIELSAQALVAAKRGTIRI